MENKLDEKLLIIKYLVDINKQNIDDLKMTLNKHGSKFSYIKTIIK